MVNALKLPVRIENFEEIRKLGLYYVDKTMLIEQLLQRWGNEDNIEDSIRMLSQLLYKHYGQKVVILIDEYDVPLDKAFQNGYYKEMVSLIRGLFGQALKTNEFLQFAVLTGCFRISRRAYLQGLRHCFLQEALHGEKFRNKLLLTVIWLCYYDYKVLNTTTNERMNK